MDFFKRLFIGVILFTSLIVLSLLGVSFATKFWIVATASKDVLLFTSTQATSLRPDVVEDLGQNTAKINFGLFEGYRELNTTFGVRPQFLYIVWLPSDGVYAFADKQLSDFEREEAVKNELWRAKEQISNETDIDLARKGFFNFKLWIAVVLLLSLAILFDLIAVGFSVLNFVTVPVNTLAGILGLYIWNGLSATFSFASVIVWAVQFHLEFRNNVMNPMDVNLHWTSTDSATFGYSLWMVVGAGIMSVANIILIFVSTLEPWAVRRTNMMINTKPADGIIMLY